MKKKTEMQKEMAKAYKTGKAQEVKKVEAKGMKKAMKAKAKKK